LIIESRKDKNQDGRTPLDNNKDNNNEEVMTNEQLEENNRPAQVNLQKQRKLDSSNDWTTETERIEVYPDPDNWASEVEPIEVYPDPENWDYEVEPINEDTNISNTPTEVEPLTPPAEDDDGDWEEEEEKSMASDRCLTIGTMPLKHMVFLHVMFQSDSSPKDNTLWVLEENVKNWWYLSPDQPNTRYDYSRWFPTNKGCFQFGIEDWRGNGLSGNGRLTVKIGGQIKYDGQALGDGSGFSLRFGNPSCSMK